MKPLLEAHNLTFAHGTRPILQGVSFTAQPGEFIALLGVNGAGKSTLLDLLAGTRKPSSGTFTVASNLPAGRTIAHLPQTIHPDLTFTARQVVAMGRYPHTDRWFESPEDDRQVQIALARTSATPLADRPFATLSGGERQRILLAACLAQAAPILLLDEPSTFLDIAAQLECFSLLREEARQGSLCIAVTHDLNLALTHCTRLLVLSEGRITEDLQTASLPPDQTWLQTFSPRLRLGETTTGSPWVWYA